MADIGGNYDIPRPPDAEVEPRPERPEHHTGRPTFPPLRSAIYPGDENNPPPVNAAGPRTRIRMPNLRGNVLPTEGWRDRIRTRHEDIVISTDELLDLEISTVATETLAGTNRLPRLLPERPPQEPPMPEGEVPEEPQINTPVEHLSREQRRERRQGFERRAAQGGQPTQEGPTNDAVAYEAWRTDTLRDIRTQLGEDINWEDTLGPAMAQATDPDAPVAAQQVLQPEQPLLPINVRVSQGQPGIFNYVSEAPRPLPAGRLHGEVSQIGLNQQGEVVLVFGDGQVSLLPNSFRTYRPDEGGAIGLPFTVREIRSVNGENIVEFFAQGNVVRETRTLSLDSFIANLNDGRVVLHDTHHLHIGRLRGLDEVATGTPASRENPGLQPFTYQPTVPGIITEPITHIGVDGEGELVVRHRGDTIWRGNPRGSVIGRTVFYRDPNRTDAPVRLTAMGVVNTNGETIIQFGDRNRQIVEVGATDFLNSINNGTDIDRWRVDWEPNNQRPRAETLAPEPIEQPFLLTADVEGEWTAAEMFRAVDGPFRENQYTLPPENIRAIEFPDQYIFTRQIPFLIPNGAGRWYANPDAAPYAYINPRVRPPQDSIIPRYVNGERITRGDSGLFALCAAATPNPEDQAQLYLRLAAAIVDIHTRHPDLQRRWIDAQTTPQQTEFPRSSYEILAYNDLVEGTNTPRRAQERLLALDYTDPNRPRFDEDAFRENNLRNLEGLRDAVATGRLEPYQIRQLEFFSHSIDVGRMFMSLR